ncbi:DUF3068 domain-containing protein [Streptomyces alkaliterrae]|uniref:DUF3068 domain-containing protein n=1 Tax=Streptomyces alkaliterrae TaxID=2213162 RepID=A0A5P0YNH1_9ACTN|nr:DUF3068 domain-containing protein [Streptomyces alkaliterrae]MBB1253737.1 DUF3068 domain-containing protein [Streptomyces alkaliterrae]MBB1260246.1 DUF3068 domain-containing protein [Streptomyces alkaliterrae]MQS01904.1 DUF3068 domain-containing protein [Streptomyces alkaliterrae]
MRRSASPLSLILLGIGVFLLVLGPMLAWYVEPRAKRTPIDVDQTTVFNGTGTYFDQSSVRTRDNEPLTITRRVMGNVAESERNGVAVWDVSTTIDTETTLKRRDPRKSLQWTTERWVSDRETNRPVHCCGETPKKIQGEAYLKFPFGVEERDYRWWDSTLGDAVTVKYDKRVKVKGYEGMRFTATVEATRTGSRQVPGALLGVERPQVMAEEWYENGGIELVVDEATGRILRAKIAPKLTLRAPGGAEKGAVTLLESGGIVFDDKTQEAQVKQAKADSKKLRTVGTTAPVASGAAGTALALAGGVLLIRGRREE